ncbi:unnamed protein product [Trichogramma brassicae]|uniref:Uncharacterized protein n=1 Tax=Trichogramma brassicae TaxID=86971 RepID=A0A6H5IEU6_9HYME|nr:unnamed protein product [Trichogramma brassicae]
MVFGYAKIPTRTSQDSSSSNRRQHRRRLPSSSVAYCVVCLPPIRPVPASRHTQQQAFVFKDLSTCEYVNAPPGMIRSRLTPHTVDPHRGRSQSPTTARISSTSTDRKAFSTDRTSSSPPIMETCDEGESI